MRIFLFYANQPFEPSFARRLMAEIFFLAILTWLMLTRQFAEMKLINRVDFFSLSAKIFINEK